MSDSPALDSGVDGQPEWSFNPESLFTSSAVAGLNDMGAPRRAETAPTILMELAAFDADDIPESEAYRCTPEYHQLYYSHMPRDPRMPVPLRRRAHAAVATGGNQTGVPATSTGSPFGASTFGRSSFTGDIVSAPRMAVASPGSVVPGRVVTPATAATLLNDPSGQCSLPAGARIVYVTDPPKTITPSTIYVLLPPGTQAPSFGATTVVQAPPSFSVAHPRPASGGMTALQSLIPSSTSPPNVMFSANGQYLIAHTTTPPQFSYAAPPAVHQPTVTVGRPPLAAATGAPERPPLVQQYVDTKATAEWNVKLIVSHIVEFCRDQDGSRFIQKQLDVCSDNVHLVLREVLPAAGELMCDVFGNYVIQKLLDVVNEEKRLMLVDLIKGNIVRLSFQTYGCRVIQKALDVVPSKHMAFVADELAGHIPQCVFDQNANHVVQKCIEKMASRCQFIADAFVADLKNLSCHAYGCRVLQKLFEACYFDEERVPQNPYAPTDLSQLLHAVLHRAEEFVLNQYGNYVVQHGMANSPKPLKAKFVDTFVPRIFELSKSKFGSNVAEKVIEHAREDQRAAIVKLLLVPSVSGGSEPALVTMMRDAFANYVVQRLLDRSDRSLQEEMVAVILPHVSSIAETTFGKPLLIRMEKAGLIAHAEVAKLAAGSASRDGAEKMPPRQRGAHHKSDGRPRSSNTRSDDDANGAFAAKTEVRGNDSSRGKKSANKAVVPNRSPPSQTLSLPPLKDPEVGAAVSLSSSAQPLRVSHEPYKSPGQQASLTPPAHSLASPQGDSADAPLRFALAPSSHPQSSMHQGLPSAAGQPYYNSFGRDESFYPVPTTLHQSSLQQHGRLSVYPQHHSFQPQPQMFAAAQYTNPQAQQQRLHNPASGPVGPSSMHAMHVAPNNLVQQQQQQQYDMSTFHAQQQYPQQAAPILHYPPQQYQQGSGIPPQFYNGAGSQSFAPASTQIQVGGRPIAPGAVGSFFSSVPTNFS